MKNVRNILRRLLLFTFMVLGILYLDANFCVQSDILLDFQELSLEHSMKERSTRLTSPSFGFVCDDNQNQDEKRKLNQSFVIDNEFSFTITTVLFNNTVCCFFTPTYPLFFSDTSPPLFA